MGNRLYFDCPTGIAGDMAVGALLDLGYPFEEVAARVRALGIDGLSVSSEKVTRGGIAGTRYRVDAPNEHAHRGLREIRPMIARAGLHPRAEALALDAFQRLAVAEARLHATTPEEVHFHEVGAADALADVVAFATAYVGLGLEPGGAGVSPLPWSRGRVEAAHGSLPVPAPAALELTRDFVWEQTSMEGELVTPTGAALLAAVASPGAGLGSLRVRKVGFGAGSREVPGRPNLTRAVLGDEVVEAGGGDRETAVVVETNIDDLTPQLAGALADCLRAGGALDVWTTPTLMKKGRPGFVLSVLSAEESLDRLVAILFRESTTIGLRVSRVERRVLAREIVTVETEYGPIRVKVARSAANPREVINVAPEFDDVRSAAQDRDVPIKAVLAAAARAAEKVGR